jgi:hypothetical protein
LMSKGFVFVAVSPCRRIVHTARRFDGKPDGRFVLKIQASAFTVVSV